MVFSGPFVRSSYMADMVNEHATANPVLLNYALALLSGILLFLVHPRFNLAFLAPVAIAPLFTRCLANGSRSIDFSSATLQA